MAPQSTKFSTLSFRSVVPFPGHTFNFYLNNTLQLFRPMYLATYFTVTTTVYLPCLGNLHQPTTLGFSSLCINCPLLRSQPSQASASHPGGISSVWNTLPLAFRVWTHLSSSSKLPEAHLQFLSKGVCSWDKTTCRERGLH